VSTNETQHSDNNQEDDIVGDDGGSSYEVETPKPE
jgi:hypothetical protein